MARDTDPPMTGLERVRAIAKAHREEVAEREAKRAEPEPCRCDEMQAHGYERACCKCEAEAELAEIRERNRAFWPTFHRIARETVEDMNAVTEIDSEKERT